ncbi:MAG TPA: serine hydrolase [Stellaceae bacterium]|jgi:CubicO group peptidase (beta-lactamase class C family)|nr:serine hydrolase [Stellaceae bacterium]
MRRIAALAFAMALLPVVAAAEAPTKCAAPANLNDGWKVAAPAQEGLDPMLICAIGPHLGELEDADPHAVVVVRHGVLVYEHYFTGGDERVPGQVVGQVLRDASTLHDMYSVTKSVTALLTGIGFDRGWLKNIDASVFSFLPQYADLKTPEKDRITVRDLLTMSSGLAWPELAVSYADAANVIHRMENALDPFRFLLAQPLAAPPGTLWNYNSGAVELLGVILQKASGRLLDQIAKTALFDPLGITHWRWGAASSGLELRPRDLAKIGQLILNRGLWDGRRVVSASWIEAMTAPHIALPSRFSPAADAYGYLWWLGRSAIKGREIGWVGGLGHGGQRLYVVPSLDLVVAVTAGNYTFGAPHGEGLAGSTARGIVLHAAMAP